MKFEIGGVTISTRDIDVLNEYDIAPDAVNPTYQEVAGRVQMSIGGVSIKARLLIALGLLEQSGHYKHRGISITDKGRKALQEAHDYSQASA